MSAGQQRAVNAEGYHPRPTTRAAFVVEPDGRRPKSIAERGWVRFGGTVTELGWAAIHGGQWKNPPALVMRQLRARQERSYVNLQRYCEERHAAEDKAQADRLLERRLGRRSGRAAHAARRTRSASIRVGQSDVVWLRRRQ